MERSVPKTVAKEFHIVIVEHAPEAGQINRRRRAMCVVGDRKRVATGVSTSYLQPEAEAQLGGD